MKKGFTLIELLVVVLIIGVLSAIALPQYSRSVEKARAAEAIQILGDLARAQKMYHMAGGQYINNMTKLDLEMPNVCDTEPHNIAHTNTFKIQITAHSASEFAAYAQRIKTGSDTLDPATGTDQQYAIMLTMDEDGNMTRKCQLSPDSNTIPDICKAIANSVDGIIL